MEQYIRFSIEINQNQSTGGPHQKQSYLQTNVPRSISTVSLRVDKYETITHRVEVRPRT